MARLVGWADDFAKKFVQLRFRHVAQTSHDNAPASIDDDRVGQAHAAIAKLPHQIAAFGLGDQQRLADTQFVRKIRHAFGVVDGNADELHATFRVFRVQS